MKLCLNCQRSFTAADWRCPHCGHVPGERNGFPTFAPRLAELNDGFNPGFFQLMVEVEPSHFWFVSRNRILRDALRKHFTAPASVLEIGCGTGFVLSAMRAEFPKTNLSASDIYTEGLGYAKRRVPDAFVFQMDALHIPFRDEFDLIGAFDVLEHIEDDEAVLAQIYQACKGGGGVALTVPQHRWLWSRMDDFAHHKRRYTRADLEKKLKQAGFKVEYATSFISILLPLMLAARLLRKPAGCEMEDQMDAAGLSIGTLTNAVLSMVMAVERNLIRIGLRLPLGGSLLIIARKPINAGNN
ncbi:trans-aconitate 2-methyltransferase [mine drainage metagenome]|uniref:Trans-aconitate 2-methyltransferase n=1 Tax=mine drainage metagenome TaxID=410659 RepID=A0A1J5SDH7_9ZZZZ